jgi:hypothetical protein
MAQSWHLVEESYENQRNNSHDSVPAEVRTNLLLIKS